MDPTVLTMDPVEADAKAAAYELSKRKDDETLLAAKIYRLLADGKKVLDVPVAIREGGFNDAGFPRLAIARADRLQVCFEWTSWSDVAAFNANAHENWGRQWPTLIERLNFNRRPPHYLRGFALVPMIPADVSLEGYQRSALHILWEVEAWAKERIGAKPPTDPYLLKRIGGDLFEVLAEWDLTEVEKYVMAGRARLQL